MATSNWTVLCDFDGTITLEDVTDTLLARLGRPGWEGLEADWRDGRIGSRECMAGQIALLGGDTRALDAVIDAIGIDPGFPRFASTVRTLGVPVVILSDGLDYAIERILGNCGLGPFPVVANRLLHMPDAGWRLDFPHARTDCRSGNCKCACARELASRGRSTLLIGDGQSDICVAMHADFVFAKHGLLEHCRSNGIAHRAIASFTDATALLPALLAGELTPAAHPDLIPLQRVQYA